MGGALDLDRGAAQTDADRSHPYHAFVRLLKVREITGTDLDEPGVRAARARVAREIRADRYLEATALAEEAFHRRDYAAYLTLLRPFGEMLSPSQQKKLELAATRSRSTR